MNSTQQLISKPGFYTALRQADYHADPCEIPSLSSSIARTLLEKGPAAAYNEHSRFGGVRRQTTPQMDTGSLVHAILANTLDQSAEIGHYNDFRSKNAQAWREFVNGQGKLAILEKDLEEATAIAGSIRKNVANGGITNSPFRDGVRVESESVAMWQDLGGIWCRAMFDRLVFGDYLDAWDWKIVSDVTDRAIERSIVKYGYHIQEAFYRAGLAAVLPEYAGRIAFTFVFALSVKPYTVRRVCLSPDFVAVGKRDVADAMRLWQTCTATNTWPDGSEQTLHVFPPTYLLDDEITTTDE